MTWQHFFAFTGTLSAFLLLAGLWRPWIVLWWRSHQNRKMVLRWYGTSFLVSALAFWVVQLLQ
ncbi:MAG TPA: hypothetical protein VF191_10965 [Cyclobacteriaceae bacterium]